MTESKPKRERRLSPVADALVHPIRLRIVMALIEKRLTTRQIAAILPDVAQASLYRHIRKLSATGILRVVDETPVRGVVEKVYALAESAGTVSEDDLKQMSKEEHIHLFAAFTTSLLTQFRNFVHQVDG